ncbi:hypothetical protein BC628DRAFT_1421293 [Trametes gibbosa]|nr:hypothetical protein BC628DRAFT_1421293 [Trametes gibbosa]
MPEDSRPKPAPIAFEGDYFGNDYDNTDFPGFDSSDCPDLSGMSKRLNSVWEGSDDEDDEYDEAVGRDAVDGEYDMLQQAAESQQCNPANDNEDNPPEDNQSPALDPSEINDSSASAAPGGIDPTVHDWLREEPSHIPHFGGCAGEPINSSAPLTSGYRSYGDSVEGSTDNPYAPFRSHMNWKIAEWAKERSPTSNAFSELLAIKGLVETLGLSYKNTNELNTIIDDKLRHRRPLFSRFEAEVMGEKCDMYARPILECIAALLHDPEHSQYLCFAPKRHYANSDKTVRLYHDLHTGEWWWKIQRKLEAENAGATVIPIILSSDKTQITLFRNKSAYPVYLTIRNLPKSIRQKPGRRGQILLAYLPTSCLDHITNKVA